jgi:pentatricopeptide repeat protein
MSPNRFIFLPALNARASLRDIEKGRCVHEEIIQSGYESDVIVGSSLIDMYAKCGSMEDAHRVFNRMPTQNVISWTSMIQGYVRCGEVKRALELFWQMQQEGVEPNHVTFIGVLNACASVAALDKGRHAHQQIIQSGCYSDIFVANSLVDMYANVGALMMHSKFLAGCLHVMWSLGLA